jgi:hypothetical protein
MTFVAGEVMMVNGKCSVLEGDCVMPSAEGQLPNLFQLLG